MGVRISSVMVARVALELRGGRGFDGLGVQVAHVAPQALDLEHHVVEIVRARHAADLAVQRAHAAHPCAHHAVVPVRVSSGTSRPQPGSSRRWRWRMK